MVKDEMVPALSPVFGSRLPVVGGKIHSTLPYPEDNRHIRRDRIG